MLFCCERGLAGSRASSAALLLALLPDRKQVTHCSGANLRSSKICAWKRALAGCRCCTTTGLSAASLPSFPAIGDSGPTGDQQHQRTAPPRRLGAFWGFIPAKGEFSVKMTFIL